MFGGTGTAITTQSKNQDLAKRFLYEAKISKQGSTNIWTVLGFDPLRMDIWDSDAMKEPNIFTDYFGTGIFDTIIKMKDSFYPTNVTDPLFPSANLLIANDVLFNALTVRAQTPAEVLKDAADELRSY